MKGWGDQQLITLKPDEERMKRAEEILVGGIILGLFFKLMHWPGASAILVLCMGGLAIFYFPLGILLFGTPARHDQIKWFSAVGGLAMGISLIGVLFKLQRWPLNDTFLLVGAGGCALVLALALFLLARPTALASYLYAMITRTTVLGLLAFAFQNVVPAAHP